MNWDEERPEYEVEGESWKGERSWKNMVMLQMMWKEKKGNFVDSAEGDDGLHHFSRVFYTVSPFTSFLFTSCHSITKFSSSSSPQLFSHLHHSPAPRHQLMINFCLLLLLLLFVSYKKECHFFCLCLLKTKLKNSFRVDKKNSKKEGAKRETKVEWAH